MNERHAGKAWRDSGLRHTVCMHASVYTCEYVMAQWQTSHGTLVIRHGTLMYESQHTYERFVTHT